MKSTQNERELLALRIQLAHAKLRLNAAQLARTNHTAALSPATLLTTAVNGRQAWQWLALPINKYLKLALATAWLWGNLRTTK